MFQISKKILLQNLIFLGNNSAIIEYYLNVFTEFSKFNGKNNFIFIKRIAVLEPTISCVRDKDSTTVSQRHS